MKNLIMDSKNDDYYSTLYTNEPYIACSNETTKLKNMTKKGIAYLGNYLTQKIQSHAPDLLTRINPGLHTPFLSHPVY